MTIAAVGGVILWFGWYGFNPGSTLSAMDLEGIGRVATNTTLAAGRGTFVALESPATPAQRSVEGRPLERQEVEELVEARELIEVQLAGMAAERGTAAQLARLRASVEQLELASASPFARCVALAARVATN